MTTSSPDQQGGASHTGKRRFWVRLLISIVVFILVAAIVLGLLVHFKIIPLQWYAPLLTLGPVLGGIFSFVKSTLVDKDFQGPATGVGAHVESAFLVGAPLPGASEYYGRFGERSTLFDRTHKGFSTSIVGPRRIGKTWLIGFLQFALIDEFGTLADGIYKEMQARNLSVEKLVFRTFRDYSTQIAAQTVISPTPLESLVHAQSIRAEISPYAAYGIFDSWLGNVEAVLERENRTLLLMLDEFEKLEEVGQKGIFELPLLLDWSRNIIQYHPRIALLFSGLHTFEEMKEQQGMSWSGYFVNVQTLHVSFLQEDEARRLVTSPTKEFSGEDIYEDGVVEYILDQTRCHPFLVQAVCYALIENLNAQKKERASTADVDGAIERVFENFNNHFSDLWKRTDAHQRACLVALQKSGTASIEHLQEQSGLQEHVLWRTLDTLVKRDLVRKDDDRYSISTPIFVKWIAHNSRYME